MKVKEILNVTKGKMLCGNEELEVENFSKDTRTIQRKAGGAPRRQVSRHRGRARAGRQGAPG